MGIMRIFWVFIVLVCGATALQGQTKLGKTKKNLSKRTGYKTGNDGYVTYTGGNGSSSARTNDDDDTDRSFLIELLLELGLPVIKLAAAVPYLALIETPWEGPTTGFPATMTPYAFANGNKGLYTYEENKNPRKFAATLTDRFVFENRNIQGNHVNLNLRFWQRAGVEIDHLLLWENNPNFGKDQLSMLSILAKYYRVRTERFVGWWGLGVNYVGSSVNEAGFAYGLGIEAFVAKPISLEATFNGSWINQQHISRFNAGLNYHVKNIKLLGGYEYLQLGAVKFSLFSLGAGITF